MFPLWSRILIIVTIVHVVTLKFCWVGMAVPRPAPQASFAYLDRAVSFDEASSLSIQEKALSVIDSTPMKEDAINWRILQQPKKGARDVRLGL